MALPAAAAVGTALLAGLARTSPGQTVPVTVVRGGVTTALSVVIGERPG